MQESSCQIKSLAAQWLLDEPWICQWKSLPNSRVADGLLALYGLEDLLIQNPLIKAINTGYSYC